MALLILRNDDKGNAWRQELLKIDSSLEVIVYPEPHKTEAIKMATVWKHPEGLLHNYTGLLGIQSMGAGVDFILKDPSVGSPQNPSGLTRPIMRVVDEQLTADMAEYVLTHCLAALRDLQHYEVLSKDRRWEPSNYRRASETTVGILGLGTLGMAAGKALLQNGFQVRGWARSSKKAEGISVYAGAGSLNEFLAGSQIVVCLLPLTPETSGILNAKRFKQMDPGTFLINAARGGHLIEADLIPAIDSGLLSGACLDVFQEEPLPREHPFWEHPKIRVTPHVASVSDPSTVAAQIVANYKNLLKGVAPQNLVDLEKGY
ncbi:glyoxylate/hydroxypyruvate reductase A [Robiginitalea myxolifaciens]|uniref:Glyoxylate/hydroxypyruvate reductase A n=1 Tax=Robiginitalea myxolifaciens TaxID=400055 RepID=A0A1I6GXF0_9FLAO|nr:glyoxylate/hydroxypyruvate reductase A [Robiginitalea myxolifaciens]SFR46924.1 glyoxylate/hydroxypyruvate reductase A [Robiginitalea myxolifaciens]